MTSAVGGRGLKRARDDAEDKCPLCLEAPSAGRALPCGGAHVLCRQCLRQLVEYRCPICRDESEAVVTFLFDRTRPRPATRGWLISSMRSAIRKGHPALVAELLALKAPLAAPDETGKLPLHVAAESGQTTILQALLAAGAAVDAVAPQTGCTALALGATSKSAGVLPVLLAAGATLEAQARDGTALHYAARFGTRVQIEQLAAANADLEATVETGTYHGFTPLGLAVEAVEEDGWIQVEALLRAGADPERPARQHPGAFAQAVAVFEREFAADPHGPASMCRSSWSLRVVTRMCVHMSRLYTSPGPRALLLERQIAQTAALVDRFKVAAETWHAQLDDHES